MRMNGSEPSREDLLRQAQSLGVEHPENMTRVELARAIEQAATSPAPRASTRGGSWLDLARQLLAAVVEQGLNMPDAAALIRGESKLSEPPKPQPPLATVTLAKIYAAQGHVSRALSVLAEVLTVEPDHQAALDLQSQIKTKSTTDAPRRKAPPSPAMPVTPAQASAPVKVVAPTVAVEPRVDPVPAVDGAAEQQPEVPQVNVSSEPELPIVAGGEEDSLVLLVRHDEVPVLSWQLAKATEAARLAGNAIEIEWLTFAPSWQGPTRQLVRLPVTHAVGRIAAPKAVSPALTHAVLGIKQGAKLVPLAVLVIAEAAQGEGGSPRISRGHTASREVAAAVAAQ